MKRETSKPHLKEARSKKTNLKVNTIRSAVVAIKSRAAVLKVYGALTASDADAFIRDAEEILKELGLYQ